MAFEQKESMTRNLKITVLVTAFLFVLQFIGLYLSSRNVLTGLTEIHHANQAFDYTRQIKQIVISLGDILRTAGKGVEPAQAQAVFKMALEQESKIYERLLALEGLDPDIRAQLVETQKLIESFEESANRLLVSPDKFEDERAVARQFELEAIEQLTQTQAAMRTRADQTFARMYDKRFTPILAGSLIAISFLMLSAFWGMRLIRRFNSSMGNLAHATAQVTGGNLNFRAPILRPDEIGLVTDAFNNMTQTLRNSTVSKDYVENILESMLDSLIIVSPEGTILQVNRVTLEIFGFAKNELIGHPYQTLLGKEFKLAAGVREVETYVRSKSGKTIAVAVTVTVTDRMSTDGGGAGDLVCVIKDITERKKAEDNLKAMNLDLEAANKELEAFSYSVSHDLRAPLRGIDGFSQALIEDLGPKLDEDSKGYLTRIRTGVQRMGNLIDDMLSLSKLSRKELVYKPVDMSELARSVFDDLQKSAPERVCEFVVKDEIRVDADPALLRILLENLIGNAWKYSSKVAAAKIEFGIARDQEKEAFYVKDNGAGFDMAYSEKLFGAFQRLHRADEFPGTGVGLATVQRVVHRHGGRIWAKSAVNEGACFYFTLG